MKTAIISSKQLLETGRWDAGYNIALKENRSKVAKLLKGLGHENLLMLAGSLPMNKKAMDVINNHRSTAKNFKDWLAVLSPTDLALYMALSYNQDELKTLVEEHRIKATQLEIANDLLASHLK